MLPYLEKNKEASISVAPDHVKRKADDGSDDEYDGLKAACADLFDAIRKNDHTLGATALRAAFDLCDSEPHVEGPHLEGDQ